MNNNFSIILEETSSEIIQKKSRFIATAIPIKNEDEALNFLQKISKKYWDAKHNCYAYIVGDKQEIKRFSDDKEPSGTAGKPILEVIEGANLTNILVVVTRYFGGILLGTGGLVRAYSLATKEAINNAKICPVLSGFEIDFSCDYSSSQKVLRSCMQLEIPIISSEYSDKVSFSLAVSEEKISKLQDKITEATSAPVNFNLSKTITFCIQDSKAIIL